MMKKVVALKNYTDPYYIFREGMIYNLEDSVANKFVALGIMTEGTPDDVVITSASTSGTQIADIKINGQSNKIYAPAGGGGGGVLIVGVTETTGDHSETYYTLNKTWQEIHDAFVSGTPVITSSYDGRLLITVASVSYDENGSYYVSTAEAYGVNTFESASADGYPSYMMT